MPVSRAVSGAVVLLITLLYFSNTAQGARPVTFYRDVAPIAYRSCAPCHHTGGIGPFPLISLEDFRKHASQIVDVTVRRYMPPWPPAPGYGEFKGDRHLTKAGIQLLADWVSQGKAEGKPADAPAAPEFRDEWQIGRPDLILRMPQPFQLPASGADLFRNFVIPNSLTDVKYIRGFELRLNTKRAVHHANVVLDRTQSLRERDGRDGKPGFAGMDVITEAAADEFEPDSHFLFWKPASVLVPEPDDLSWRLTPGTDLILNLHLQPTGKPEAVTAEIGLYFAAKPATRFPMLIQLEDDGAISIPPGARQFTVRDHLTIPVDVDLLAIYPHAHYLGKSIEAQAKLPNGTMRPLIRIPDWDINWQATYEYRQPIFLPRGTEVSMRVVYDNSESNPRNPNHPPKLVVSGDRSQDEMGHVWLQVLPRPVLPKPVLPKKALPTPVGSDPADPRMTLQEAVMRRRLEKYPGDFLAEYNLGALLQSEGRLDEALDSYRKALGARPDSATARNSAGTVLLIQNQLAEATEQFRAALAVDPHYLNARYNLARSLAAGGDLGAARSEYLEVIRQKPDDGGAQAALGTVCFRLKDYPCASDHLRTASRLMPADADVQANLGTVLAITGDLPAAIAAFENALRLNPEQAAARQNLARARAALAARR